MSRKTESPVDLDITPARWTPLTEQDRAGVRQQLARVIESAPFRTSKRCPALLSYVVDKTLEGDTEALKERSLGIDVFKRNPQYDTNADPVVRIAAGEVRKRLAQYYYESGNRPEIRIELPPGSYVPEFYSPDGRFAGDRAGEAHSSADTDASKGVAADSAASRPVSVRENRWRFLVPMLCLIAGLAGGVFATRMRPAVASAPLTAMDEFWGPIVSAPGTVWLCVGEAYVTGIELDPNGARNRFASSYRLSSGEQRAYPALNMADTTVVARVAGLLQSRNKSYSVHGETETTFSDLAGGPAVLIGSFNNDWTIRLSDQLRFRFEMDRDSGVQWIADREKPDEKIGIHSFNLATPDTRDAYAIISRVHDPSTGQMVVALAGVSANATQAAGTFVSEPGYLEEFAKHAPRGWTNGNVQIVIATPMVDGALGPPHVVDSYTW